MRHAKQTTTIEKPIKVLREPLALRKAEFEKKGWTISQGADMTWNAEKKFKADAFITKINKAKTITELFDAVGMIELRNKASDSSSTTSASLIEKQTSVETASPDTVVAIETTNIVPSRFEPQARRRAHFKDEEIEELGNSILRQGLISPIVVRPIDGAYEIVVGERRWLASRIKNLPAIKCFVQNLPDELALEIQLQENLQRKDVDPLDEAFSYRYLLEHSKKTIADLAAEFGKPEKFIRLRLKLNDLIPEAIAEIEAGDLPLGHALEIAKYPVEAQKFIIGEQMPYRYGDKDDGAQPLKDFRDEIEDQVLRKLENAPFGTEDPRLRADNLICPNCRERTGYEPKLFDELSKGDSCLNKACFELKTKTHLELKRAEITASLPNPRNLPVEELAAKVPLVTDRSWIDDDVVPFKEKPLTSQKFIDEPECEYAQASLIVGGERKGETTFVCNNKKCEIHSQKIESEAKPGDRLPYELQKLEREFEIKVGMQVRRDVFRQAIEYFEINEFWDDDRLLKKLLIKFWFSCGYDTKSTIAEIISDWENFPAAKAQHHDRGVMTEFISSFDERKVSQFLFLLTFADEGFMSYSVISQDVVKELASLYCSINYRLADAATRLELAPKEFKSIAEDYFNKIDCGESAEIPHFWWNTENDSPA